MRRKAKLPISLSLLFLIGALDTTLNTPPNTPMTLGIDRPALASETAVSPEIRQPMENWVEAFKNVRLDALEKAVDPGFMKRHGGEKAWKKRLETLHSKYSTARIEQIRSKDRTDRKVFVQIRLRDVQGKVISAEDDSAWYLLHRTSEGWKVHSIHHDFD